MSRGHWGTAGCGSSGPLSIQAPKKGISDDDEERLIEGSTNLKGLDDLRRLIDLLSARRGKLARVIALL